MANRYIHARDEPNYVRSHSTNNFIHNDTFSKFIIHQRMHKFFTFTPCILLHLLYSKPTHAPPPNTPPHPQLKTPKLLKKMLCKNLIKTLHVSVTTSRPSPGVVPRTQRTTTPPPARPVQLTTRYVAVCRPFSLVLLPSSSK
jgi:hypothetical protein